MKKGKTLTASNERIQAYLQCSIAPSTSAKKKRFAKFEEVLKSTGNFLTELFPNKQSDVLDEILFLTSGCGICKIGADRLADRANVSIRTVSTVVSKLKNTDQYIIARINSNRAGKYIFVDKLHKNFKEIMNVVFNVDAKQFAYQVASLSPAQNVDTAGENGEKSDSNQFNQDPKTCSLYNNSDSDKNEVVQGIQQEIENEPVINLDDQKERLNEYATNQIQHLVFDTMRLFTLHQDIENNLYKIALRVGSNATMKEFAVAKDVIFELNLQLIQATTVVKESVTALFTDMYNAALTSCEPAKKVIEQPRTVSDNFVFYNWLDEREG